MNRCTKKPVTARLHLASALLLAACALPAFAQTAAEFKPNIRQFPVAALRGELVVVAPPEITLDGKADRLSPGSRIRDANNMLVMSGALVNQKVAVNYVRESAGHVHEVWILNSEEVRLKRPNSKKSWFSFFDSTEPAPLANGATP